MNAKLIELAERQKILVAMAATQRAELSQALAPWREALAVVDRGLVGVRYVRSYAALLVGVVAFVVPLLPWRMAKWLRRDGLVWRVVHAVKRILPGLQPHFSVAARPRVQDLRYADRDRAGKAPGADLQD